MFMSFYFLVLQPESLLPLMLLKWDLQQLCVILQHIKIQVLEVLCNSRYEFKLDILGSASINWNLFTDSLRISIDTLMILPI